MSHKNFLIVTILIAIVIFSLPYLIGFWLTPPGYTFHGPSLLNPGDPSVYYSYMEQARQGKFVMIDAFTSERQTFPLIQPWWWLLGRAADMTGLTVPIMYAAARLALIPLLAITIWWATGWALPQIGERRIGYLLALFGGGLGGLAALLYAPSGIRSYPDLWVAEAYPSLTQMSSSHFLVVTIGILVTIVCLEKSWQQRQWPLTFVAGGAALVVILLHPFHLVTWLVYALMRLLTIARKNTGQMVRYFGHWAIVGAMTLPALVWYGLQLSLDPLAQFRAAQNNNITAQIGLFAISLGLALPFALKYLRRHRDRAVQLLPVVTLAVAYCLAIYLPVNWQRRLSHGLFIPFAWLAAPLLWQWWQRWALRWRPRTVLAALAVAALLVVSPAWTIAAMARDYWLERTAGQRYLYFLSPEVQALLATVRARADPHRPILASYTNGRIIAGLTAHQVFIGQAVETVHFTKKLEQLTSFFGRWSVDEQRAFLRRHRLCYILDGPREQAYGHMFQPNTWPDLRLVWTGTTMRLYEDPTCE